MARTPDPDQMKEAMWQPMTEDRKALHRASIEAAVAQAAAAPRPVVRTRRRFSVVAVTAALLALPAGVAVAAEGALPGDPLYPVKQITETVRSWVDDDIVAEHRVDELEDLISADAASDRISDQLQRAATEVDRLESDHPLRDRLSDVTRSEGVVGSDAIADHGPTTTLPSDRPGPGAPGNTTTTSRPPTDGPNGPGSDRTTTTVANPGSVLDTTTTTTPVDTTTTTVTDTGTVRVLGRVMAGPTCPVERFPPDPDCDDQPVQGARLVVLDDGGIEVASVESNEGGRFQLRLGSGTYLLVPQPYDGLLGTAPSQEFIVGTDTVELRVEYDTGIR